LCSLGHRNNTSGGDEVRHELRRRHVKANEVEHAAVVWISNAEAWMAQPSLWSAVAVWWGQ
jgi:hypothetical protein